MNEHPKNVRLLDTAELAAMLGVSERTVRRHVKAGLIPAVRIGKLVRFHPDHIEKIFLQLAGLSTPLDQ
ncbi:MAG: helix-turn-helix domain-containing protein [Acetobacteraceae bacterium]|nr:helix-turn-helix domain-containing protein [Acetobacteraceae bacterium]